MAAVRPTKESVKSMFRNVSAIIFSTSLRLYFIWKYPGAVIATTHHRLPNYRDVCSKLYPLLSPAPEQRRVNLASADGIRHDLPMTPALFATTTSFFLPLPNSSFWPIGWVSHRNTDHSS